MATTVAAGFDTYLSRLTPSSTAITAASKHRNSVESALQALGLQRFVQTGSFNHGTGVYPFSDVDYLAAFTSLRPSSSDYALSWVRSRLMERFAGTSVEVRRPAVVINFSSGAERFEVVPAWHKRDQSGYKVYDIPGASDGWIESAPDAHVAYVNDCNNDVGGGKAKGLARLSKAWKYERNVQVSSFYLEMRAARHARNNKPVIYAIDFRTLLLDLEGFAAMNDPKQIVGRIYAASSQARKDDAISKLHTAQTRADNARSADAAGNIAGAFDWWDKVFNGSFPAYG